MAFPFLLPGRVTLERAIKKIEEGRLHAVSFGKQHSGRSYGASPELMAERLPFLGTAQYRFTELFFSTAHYKPVKFVGRLERIGKSSLTNYEYLVCDTTDHRLITSLQSSITVGRETRRPELWFVQKSKHLSPTKQLFDPYKGETAPPGGSVLCSSTYIIAHSDTDYNHHCGNSSYIRFCLDAALQRPEFAKFVEQETEILNTKYLSGSNVGDTLRINAWADGKDDSTLHWAVAGQKDKKPVFVMSDTFKPTMTSC